MQGYLRTNHPRVYLVNLSPGKGKTNPTVVFMQSMKVSCKAPRMGILPSSMQCGRDKRRWKCSLISLDTRHPGRLSCKFWVGKLNADVELIELQCTYIPQLAVGFRASRVTPTKSETTWNDLRPCVYACALSIKHQSNVSVSCCCWCISQAERDDRSIPWTRVDQLRSSHGPDDEDRGTE